MSWEKLKRGASVKSQVPAISIQKSGRVTWNVGAQEALGSPQYVDVLCDLDGNRFGLRKASGQGADTFPVRTSARQRTWGVSARAGLRAIGIELATAFRGLAEREGDVLFIDISPLMDNE